MRALLAFIVLVIACNDAKAPPRDAIVLDDLTRLTLSRNEGGSGNTWTRWVVTPTEIVRTAHGESGELPEARRPLDAAGFQRVRAAARARGLRAVPAEPDDCGGGRGYALQLERTGAATESLWFHCKRGSLLGDIEGFAADLDALTAPR